MLLFTLALFLIAVAIGLESREYGHRDPSLWPHGTLSSQKLVLTSPTSGGRSVGIVRLRTEATGVFFFFMSKLFLSGQLLPFRLSSQLTSVCTVFIEHWQMLSHRRSLFLSPKVTWKTRNRTISWVDTCTVSSFESTRKTDQFWFALWLHSDYSKVKTTYLQLSPVATFEWQLVKINVLDSMLQTRS
jgi:hypothetical protein